MGYVAADIKLPGWHQGQVNKAITSLMKYVGKQQESSKDLLADEDEVFYVQLALKKMPLQPRKDKPIALPLPHPIFSPEGAQIALFVKDHKGEGHKEAKQMVAKFERKGGVAKVIGLSKLRTKYESFESKRELCKLYDLFLADERVVPSLPKLIGKSFFRKKKQPIPINITAKDFPAQVKKACAATYMFKNSGTCINIRVARSSQSAQEVSDNLHAALVQAVEHVPKKWSNVQGVYLKTADSVALPLFQTLPDAPQRINATATTPYSEPEPLSEDDEPAPAPAPAAAKAKKPAAAAAAAGAKAGAGSKAAPGKAAGGVKKAAAGSAGKVGIAGMKAKPRKG
uniref:Ribosomal protein L1 n=1 Tax=Chlamydomonas leiostraca TaxID=1034604 RepID=A0A6T8UZ74_9CHLO|mmetsp:Transcript_3618/g.9031  ORF Transcript_3618/g.9031 Transcript_3618/m.9031 type:complete len:341 (+) Transcript_3618:17-1039(+)